MHDFVDIMHELPHSPLRVDMAGWCQLAEDVQPHHHSTWEVVYFLEGQARCQIGADVFEAEPGMAVLTPPWVVHREIPLPMLSCLFVGIEAPMEQPWPCVYHDDIDHTFAKLCQILIREWNGREAGGDKMVDLTVNQLDTLLQRTYIQLQLSPAERLVREAENRLEQHFATPIRITEIAREMHVSRSYLDAQFTRLRGRTPMAYLQTLRVQHAIAMIRNSSLNLETIAARCGYYSASHLSRHVTQTMGRSPGSFRTK